MELIPALFDIGSIDHLLIYRLDSRKVLPMALAPSLLLRLEGVRQIKTTEIQDIHTAYEVLQAGKPSLHSKGGINALNGILFIDFEGTLRLSAYTDTFGVVGLVDEALVHFAYPTLLNWLKHRFPL